MLVGIAIAPECFGPGAVVDDATRRGAECVLLASLTKSAVLLGIQGESFLNKVIAAAHDLRTRYGQQIQSLAVENRKDPKGSFAGQASPLIQGASSIERLRHIAGDLAPDVVVCPTAEHVRALGDLGQRVELCELAGFPKSRAEAMRTSWGEPQRLDGLSAVECGRLLGRAIRYGDLLTLADKMFGQAAKTGRRTAQLQKFARGAVYVAEQWRECAPTSRAGGANLQIVTQAGFCGAAAPYIDPTIAQDAIQSAIRAIDSGKAVGTLTVLTKEQSTPPVFKDRLLASGRRVWGVRHGFDDIGGLFRQGSKMGPTFIDPDCAANRDLLKEILALPDAV